MWIWTMIIVVWLIIGFKRLPVYVKRVGAWHEKEYPHTHGEQKVLIVWWSIFLWLFWPIYEVYHFITLWLLRTLMPEQKEDDGNL